MSYWNIWFDVMISKIGNAQTMQLCQGINVGIKTGLSQLVRKFGSFISKNNTDSYAQQVLSHVGTIQIITNYAMYCIV